MKCIKTPLTTNWIILTLCCSIRSAVCGRSDPTVSVQSCGNKQLTEEKQTYSKHQQTYFQCVMPLPSFKFMSSLDKAEGNTGLTNDRAHAISDDRLI